MPSPAVSLKKPPVSELEVTTRSRPGRNDPCWCGSGQKYKKCHLDADARGEGGPPLRLARPAAGGDLEIAHGRFLKGNRGRGQ